VAARNSQVGAAGPHRGPKTFGAPRLATKPPARSSGFVNPPLPGAGGGPYMAFGLGLTEADMRVLFGALTAAALIGAPMMASAQAHDGYGDQHGSRGATAASHAPRQTGAYNRGAYAGNRGAYAGVNRGGYANSGVRNYAGDQRTYANRGNNGYAGARGYGQGYGYNRGYYGGAGYGFDVDIAPYAYGYPGGYGYDAPYGYADPDQGAYYGDDSSSGPGGYYGDDNAAPPPGYDNGYDNGGPPPQSGYDQGQPPQSGYDQDGAPPQQGYDQYGGPPNAGMSQGAPPADCGQWVWRGGQGRYVWAPAACGYGGQ